MPIVGRKDRIFHLHGLEIGNLLALVNNVANLERSALGVSDPPNISIDGSTDFVFPGGYSDFNLFGPGVST